MYELMSDMNNVIEVLQNSSLYVLTATLHTYMHILFDHCRWKQVIANSPISTTSIPSKLNNFVKTEHNHQDRSWVISMTWETLNMQNS